MNLRERLSSLFGATRAAPQPPPPQNWPMFPTVIAPLNPMFENANSAGPWAQTAATTWAGTLSTSYGIYPGASGAAGTSAPVTPGGCC